MPRPHSQQLLSVNGIDICVDIQGGSNDPTLLLLGGSTCSLDWWHQDFCQRLVDDCGFRVVRVDYRDTGRSSTFPLGRPGYGFDDLVADIAALLVVLDCGP